MSNAYVNWRKVKQNDINLYQDTLNNSDFLLNFHNHPLSCTDAIDQAYDNLVSTIVSSSQKCFKSSKFKHFLKPYWNADLSKAHKCMSELRKTWIHCGQPRGNSYSSYTLYKNAKCAFRKQHRLCVNNYLSTLDYEIDKTAEIDSNQFWKLVSSRRKRSNSRAGAEINFNGVMYRDTDSITTQWKNYFERLYTPSDNACYEDCFKTMVDSNINNTILNSTFISDKVPDVLRKK